MKKILFIMLFLATFAGSTNAQNAPNPKRTLLFTLGANEEIYRGEYFVFQKLHQNRFACIIDNTLNNTQTFVFNGKRIAQNDELFFVHYLNVNEENGYVVEYTWQEKNYANIKGKVYGPFDMYLIFAEDNEGNENYDKFYYRKKEGENINYYVHYRGTMDGPFDGISFPDETSAADCEYSYLLAGQWYDHYRNDKNKLSQSFFWYEDNEKYYVNINGNPSRGYDHVWNFHFTENGKYAYRYSENGKWYVNINGNISRGYDNVYALHFTENEKYAYYYKENGKWHVNINGNPSSRGYDYVHDLRFTESGKYAYCYYDNGKDYVHINGNTSSRGYDHVHSLHFTESGKYAYYYKENGKLYVNINGSPSRGYDNYSVYDLHLTEIGKYAYCYEENEKWHVNINETVSRGYNRIYNWEMNDNGSYSYYHDGDDGRIYKNSNGNEIATEFLAGMNYNGNSFSDMICLFGNDNRHEAIKIYSTDREHLLHSSYKYEYIVIDGVRFGRSPALYAWYDKEKNAFIWNSVEGKELVVYEYKLN